MNTENIGTTQSETTTPDAASCCGPEMAEMAEMAEVMKACPCASFFKGSKTAMRVMMAVMGLIFLVAVTGIILGIIAFFRTL